MNDQSPALLLLNGVPHRLSMVLAQAKIAPQVTIKIADLHALPHCGGPAESLIEHQPETPEATERELVFYKQGTGYTLLLGRKKFEAAADKHGSELKGRLISTPSLKKCRVENKFEEPAPIQTRPAWEDRPRPGYQDRGYQGNRMNFDADIRAPRRPIEPASPRFGGATEQFRTDKR